MINRPERPAGNGPSSPGWSDPEFQDRWPLLHEMMTAAAYADGSPREPSGLVLFVRDGMLKATLNDRTPGRSLWGSSGTLAGLLDALEALLADPNPPWRWTAEGGGTTRKKRGPVP